MREVFSVIDDAIEQIESCKKFIKRRSTDRVRSSEELALIKSTAFAWFNNSRDRILLYVDSSSLENLDSIFSDLISSTDRSTQRVRYIRKMTDAREALIALREEAIKYQSSQAATIGSSDQPPDLTPLIHDPITQDAITRRWIECIRCIRADAPLAAIVMMGGLLEGLLLARVNLERNKAPIFTAQSAPKDRNSGSALALKVWTLRNYIDVAHEIGWISHSAKDVSEVLRDYRNYIHPFKEISHGVSLTLDDSRVIWEVVKSLTLQVLKSI